MTDRYFVPSRFGTVLFLSITAAVTQGLVGAPKTQVVELSIGEIAHGRGAGAQGIAVGDDGGLYGTEKDGGRFNAGVLFKLNREAFLRPQKGSYGGAEVNEPQANDFSTVRAFGDSRDETHFHDPTSIVKGDDAKLYVSGWNSQQCIRFDPQTQSTQALSLTPEGIDSTDPRFGGIPAILYADCFSVSADGMLWCMGNYGSTGFVFHTRGGAQDFAVLKETKDWKTVIDGGDGYLYGTTIDSVEKIKKDGSDHAVLHKFTGSDDGATEPVGAPAATKEGAVYGYAHPDQSTGRHGGILYKVNRDGTNFAVVQSLAADPDGVLFASEKCVYGVSEKGLYEACDPQSEVVLVAPSKKQHHLKAMAFDDKFAYALADNESIFRISLPSTTQAPK